MVFAAVHVLEQAAGYDGLASNTSRPGDLLLVIFEVSKGSAFNARGDTFKGNIDDFFAEAYRLKQLGTTIRVDRRNTHFRHDLEKTLVDATAIVLVAGIRCA